MIPVLCTIFAGLFGLAFGSFLNVCLSRWPAGESIVSPRSHCRECSHVLALWENVPLVSWLTLRGRCRECREWIGWRYPLVELAVGVLWAVTIWPFWGWFFAPDLPSLTRCGLLVVTAGKLALVWLLIGLAVLDAEHFWLPNLLTLPGIALGIAVHATAAYTGLRLASIGFGPKQPMEALIYLAGIVAAGGLILLIRWVYWLVRRREGLGLGDAKLMAMLAAWLGIQGALLAFGLGILVGAAVAFMLLAAPREYADQAHWALQKLPLGTFLCIGGLIGSLWGHQIIVAYLRWGGF